MSNGIPEGYTLFCTSYYKKFPKEELEEMLREKNEAHRLIYGRDWLFDLMQDRSGRLWALKHKNCYEKIERKKTYSSLMEDSAITKIVHQLQETEDLDEWWSLVEDLKTICSKEEIDLIDDAHAWNIND